MSKKRMSLTRPVKMLTIVARPDPSLTPVGSELVPLRTRVHLSYGRAQRVVQACSQQAAVFAGWLHRTSWRATERGWNAAKVLGSGVSFYLSGGEYDGSRSSRRNDEGSRMGSTWTPSVRRAATDRCVARSGIRDTRAGSHPRGPNVAGAGTGAEQDPGGVDLCIDGGPETSSRVGSTDRTPRSTNRKPVIARPAGERRERGELGNTKSTSAHVIAD